MRRLFSLPFGSIVCCSMINASIAQNYPNIIVNQVGQNIGDTVFLTADTSACAYVNPRETTNYMVSNIPYTTQTNTGTVINQGDNSQTGPFNIGFDFCFFGQPYNQFYICSNGWISFNPQPTPVPGTNAQSSVSSPINPLPNPYYANPTNCIFGVWQDWNPISTFGGSIRYQTQGIAPNRKLIVSWIEVPLQGQLYNSPNSNENGNFHIIIYESSNNIEIHVQSKTDYTQVYGDGKATQGIYNMDGTTFIGIPGRNATVWAAFNDAYRLTPSGNEITPSLVWYEVGNPLPIASDTSSISVLIDSVDKYYTCHIEYPNCFKDWAYQFCSMPDTVFVGLKSSSSVGEKIIEQKITVSPNPVTDFATLEVDAEFLNAKLNIIDYTGKNIFSQTLTTLVTKIDLNWLKSGLYYFDFEINGLNSIKFLKL